jgi:hypothetical protein
MRTGGQGGHFSAPDKRDRQMTNQMKSVCSNFVLTEGMGVSAPSGWKVRGVETRQYWSTKVWDFHEKFTLEIDTPNWVRGTRAMSHVPLELVLLTHDEISLLVGGGHLPAHLTKASQRAANEAALAGLKNAVLPLMKEYRPTVTTLFFDVNRDLKLDKNLALLKRSVRGSGLKVIKLPKPDLGGRFISCFMTTGVKPKAEMVDRIKFYDHRGGVLHVQPD